MKLDNKKDTVKINPLLLEKVEKFLKKEGNKIEYPSIKNFIDKSVLKLLGDYEKKRNKK